MKKIRSCFKILGFICLLLLALAGVGLPIPMFLKDRFARKQFHQEQVDEKEEEEAEDTFVGHSSS